MNDLDKRLRDGPDVNEAIDYWEALARNLNAELFETRIENERLRNNVMRLEVAAKFITLERDRLAKENVELCQRVNTLQNRLWVSDWNATISQLACAQSPESLDAAIDAAIQEKHDE